MWRALQCCPQNKNISQYLPKINFDQPLVTKTWTSGNPFRLSSSYKIRFLPFSFVSSTRSNANVKHSHKNIFSSLSTSVLLFSSSSNNNNFSIMSSSEEPPLLVKKLSEDATLPTKGSVQSAGFDLSASKKTTIPPGGRGIVATDLSIACPPGTYARIAPRSGLAIKKGIDVGAGVVDADYRGPVGVILFNLDNENAFEVQKGDRIAQLILEKISMTGLEEVDDLDKTDRGAGGFGSTGVSAEQPDAKKAKTDEEEKPEADK